MEEWKSGRMENCGRMEIWKMENIFKIESDILLFEYSQKNVIFTTIINQKVMKLFSITKGKKKCSSIIILFYFLLIYESASTNSAI